MSDPISETLDHCWPYPDALIPHINAEKPNEPILLYSGDIDITDINEELKSTGEIFLDWLPTPRLRFEINNLKTGHEFQPSKPTLMLADGTKCSDILITMTSHEWDEKISVFKKGITGIINGKVVRPPNGSAQHAFFLLPNFQSLIGSNVKHQNHLASASRIVLCAKGWVITLDAVADVKSVEDYLKSRSGFGITHVGKLEREDRKEFSSNDASEILTALGWYTSFSSGQWTGPCLDTGFDSQGSQAWQTWHGFRASPYRVRVTWLDNNFGEEFVQAFSCFLNHWSDEFWQEIIRLAIHWYVEANSQAGSLEGSIALTQTALELLASAILVEVHEWLSLKGAEKLSASDRIRLLLKWAGIPTDIPTQLGSLLKFAKANNYQDTATVMTEIRNSIIHPTKKNRKKLDVVSTEALFDTWRLGLWNLELCILRLIGFRGCYANRIKREWAGEVENVPWAIPETPQDNLIENHSD